MSDTSTLESLLKQWRSIDLAMTPAERAALRRETAINLAFANLTFTGRRPYIRREDLEKLYDARHST